VIARRMPAFAFSSGSRLPARLNPEARSKASNRRTTAARTRAASPTCAGIVRVLLLLVERFRRDDRAEAAPVARWKRWNVDLNVPGNGHCATTNDVFAKAMVVGALRRVRDASGMAAVIPEGSSALRKTSMMSRMPLLRTRSSECLCTQRGEIERRWLGPGGTLLSNGVLPACVRKIVVETAQHSCERGHSHDFACQLRAKTFPQYH